MIEVLLARVGLENAQPPRQTSVLMRADYQLMRWRLLNLRRHYQVKHPNELAAKACALANAQVEAPTLDAIWQDVAEWQELEQRDVSLWQRLYAH